jgi:hypothetical protein
LASFGFVRSDCLTSCCPGLQEVSLANTHLLNIQDFYALVQLGMRGFILNNCTGKFKLVLVKKIIILATGLMQKR